jgi:methylmalonyl-CoA mutase
LAVRDGAAFEALRARAAALGQPEILLSCLGPLAAHVSIAQWAKNFFEAGGVKTIASGPLEDDDAHVALLREHDLTAVAVCPGKGVEPDAQAGLIAKLREAGARTVFLAGAGDDDARQRGADAGVRDGVDMVAVLGQLLDELAGGDSEAAA